MKRRRFLVWLRKVVTARNFLLFSIPVTIAILLLILFNLSVTVDNLSVTLIERTSERTRIELDNFFNPISNTLSFVNEWKYESGEEFYEVEELNEKYRPIIKNSPQISSMIMADKCGNEYLLLEMDSVWINRSTRFLPEGKKIHRYVYDYDEDGSGVLIDHYMEESEYDPRERPWYIGARQKEEPGQISWTSPYIFFTTKEPGITTSTYSINSNGDTIITAFDILLTDLSVFSQSLETSENGITLIMTEGGRVLGLPGIDRLLSADSTKKYVLSNVEELKIPSLDMALRVWEEEGKTAIPFQFRFEGEKWWAGVISISEEGSQLKNYSVVLLPEADFMEEMNRTQIIMMAGFLLIIILTVMVIRGYMQKQKANELLAQQKNEIEDQKIEIETKNVEITDSIRYAERIQKAILPRLEKVKQKLPDSFILYKPKDIVSGDFFWFEEYKGKIMFAAVDCTGHGVPGAFMSIVGHDGLNSAVKEHLLSESNTILNQLNHSVTKTLRHTATGDVKDGMDMALCVYDPELKKLEYSGAKNPIYLVRKGRSPMIVNNEAIEPRMESEDASLYEIKADRLAIEPSLEERQFTINIIDVKPGDRVYLFSDGYADQFGGEKGKKYNYKRFKEKLLETCDIKMEEQKSQLDKTISDWMSETEQIDDIVIFAVQF